MANNNRYNSFETAEVNPYGDSNTRFDSIPSGYTVSETCPPDGDYDPNATMPPEVDNPYSKDRRRSNGGSGAYISTQPTDNPTPAPAFNPDSNYGETVVVDGDRPVVGWLIGTKGECKYKDFRLYSEGNLIGRGDKVDISIPDDSISRDDPVIEIVFDPCNSTFLVAKCSGARKIVRCNGELLMHDRLLKDGDRIQLGKSELVFKPLCGEGFNWDNEND